MHVTQLLWDATESWRHAPFPLAHAFVRESEGVEGQPDAASQQLVAERTADSRGAHLVLVFGGRPALSDANTLGKALRALREQCPTAALVFCSGGGQIAGAEVIDEALIATAIELEHGRLTAVSTTHGTDEDSAAVGARLAGQLSPRGLRYVMVLSDGLRVNGSALVRGMSARLPTETTLSGGLAGDDGEFAATLVGLNELPTPGQVVAIGFYGDRLAIGHGSLGGWEMFGPDRRVTRAAGNVVYELDGQPALALYKRYLGSFAEALPASALLFPLCLQVREGADTGLVRTVLGVNDADDSMTFAGDVPEGTFVRLMRTSREGLIAGAEGAADAARAALGGLEPAFVLLVSCIGRRLVLKNRIDEELEGAREVMGSSAVLAGFYSFGEIAPGEPGGCSALHNQTMTITALAER